MFERRITHTLAPTASLGVRSFNANGVAQQSPASRSARWVSNANQTSYPNGVPQNEPTTNVEPLRATL